MKKVFLTIDVDYTDYYSHGAIDELDLVFSEIKKVFEEFPEIKTTWFIRIDDQIKAMFGTPDFIFIQHKEKIQWLRDNGHSIGWHHHAYRLNGNYWKQEINEKDIIDSLKRNGELAVDYNLEYCRMGWGHHTNLTMKLVNEMGFNVDSSAIPRPIYKWEVTKKDWTITPQYFYHPSVNDYRIEGKPELRILEVPISTVPLSLSTDDQKGILRYINPSYKEVEFRYAVESYSGSNLVLIMHPYEIISKENATTSILSFDINVFKNNMKYLLEHGHQICAIDEIDISEHN